jgi:hypothetical protein
MPPPDPYPAGGDPTGPASNTDDAEAATPDAGEPADDTASGDDSEGEGSEEVLKNHLYLPPDFPKEKTPKAGDKARFLVEAEYVEDNPDGEHCWKVDSVDGVPIPDEEADGEEDAGDSGADEAAEGEGSDESQLPSDASDMQGKEKPTTSKGLALLIMGRGKKK